MKIAIVGSGIAGLTAAIIANKNGDDVTLFTKSDKLTESSSAWAQGGIVTKNKNEDEAILYRDMLKTSGGLTLPSMTKFFIKKAPKILEKILINEIGVPFAKDEKSENFLYTKEAGHTKNRILYKGDSTGKVIIEYLLNHLKKQKGIKILKLQMAIELINIPHHSLDPLAVYETIKCVGLYIYDIKKKKVNKYFFDKIILATGGIGQVYQYNTNPPTATGDGIALASRAGARIINMEFTQFHPTTLAIKKANNFLISETLRGEKAVLVNHAHKEFMTQYHKKGSLAPRDIVSRAIFKEQLKNKNELIYLSLKKIKIDFKQRFPTIYKKCLEYHIDYNQRGIPVTPAFHFSCGGILTNEYGETTIKNLFAIGESACTGIHGANRLASTSLLEGLLFGYQAANAKLRKNYKYNKKKIKNWAPLKSDQKIDPLFIKQNLEQLKNLMWNYVGIIRNKNNLKIALQELKELKEKVNQKYHQGFMSRELFELKNSIEVGALIASSAIKNPHSTGCHYLEDN